MEEKEHERAIRIRKRRSYSLLKGLVEKEGLTIKQLKAVIHFVEQTGGYNYNRINGVYAKESLNRLADDLKELNTR